MSSGTPTRQAPEARQRVGPGGSPARGGRTGGKGHKKNPSAVGATPAGTIDILEGQGSGVHIHATDHDPANRQVRCRAYGAGKFFIYALPRFRPAFAGSPPWPNLWSRLRRLIYGSGRQHCCPTPVFSSPLPDKLSNHSTKHLLDFGGAALPARYRCPSSRTRLAGR